MNAHRIGLLMAVLAASAAAGCGDDTGSGGAAGTGGAATATSSDAATSSGAATTSSDATTTSAGGTGGSSAVGTGGGGGAAACESGLDQDSPECQACQDASCCITATLAADDPGTWTGSAATICREANCYEECDVAQPECGGIVPTPASCTDGLYENCCAETEACAKDDACVALIYICVDDRGCDPSSLCFSDCETELGLEDGEPLFDAFLTCLYGPWPCD